jgi:DNA-binding NtrC family response regulator
LFTFDAHNKAYPGMQDNIPIKKRILIIDDESIIGISCKRILEQENYEAVYHQDPRQGLAEALTGVYDLILLDILMPGMDGMEVLRRVKAENVAADIIIITGYGTVKTAVEAMKLGAVEYVSKPFMPEELKIIIEKALKNSEMRKENVSLKNEMNIHDGLKGIISDSPQMKEIFAIIKRVAPTDGTVCITGESGTGKEVFAQAVHRLSRRNDKPFIACDCSALVPTLLESELFGHVKGSFSGAISTKQGLFEVAHKGTLFLDEISNISMETQGKLLRVLESRMVKKVGDTKEYHIDIRLITASNRDLGKMVRAGTFREDLFYRIQGFPIQLPPLRERKEDIPKLAAYFLTAFSKNNEVKARLFSQKSVETMEKYNWPGNIRELKNMVERTAILCDSETIDPEHFPQEMRRGTQEHREHQIPSSWEEFKLFKQRVQLEAVARVEKRFIADALSKADGNISRAAKNVGMQRPNFHQLMQKYNMTAKDRL